MTGGSKTALQSALPAAVSLRGASAPPRFLLLNYQPPRFVQNSTHFYTPNRSQLYTEIEPISFTNSFPYLRTISWLWNSRILCTIEKFLIGSNCLQLPCTLFLHQIGYFPDLPSKIAHTGKYSPFFAVSFTVCLLQDFPCQLSCLTFQNHTHEQQYRFRAFPDLSHHFIQLSETNFQPYQTIFQQFKINIEKEQSHSRKKGGRFNSDIWTFQNEGSPFFLFCCNTSRKNSLSQFFSFCIEYLKWVLLYWVLFYKEILLMLWGIFTHTPCQQISFREYIFTEEHGSGWKFSFPQYCGWLFR